MEDATKPTEAAEREARMAAVARAKAILGYSYERMGALVGVSGNTVRNWANGAKITQLTRAPYDRLLKSAARREAARGSAL